MCDLVELHQLQKHRNIYTSKFAPLFLNANPTNTFEKLKKNENNGDLCSYLRSCFLSKKNQITVQKLIVADVYQKSGYVIPYQKRENVYIVMQYIYNFYGQQLHTSIREQIMMLNKMVSAELTPQIINNIKSYYKYLEDSNNGLQLLDLPVNNSNKGNQTLPSVL